MAHDNFTREQLDRLYPEETAREQRDKPPTTRGDTAEEFRWKVVKNVKEEDSDKP